MSTKKKPSIVSNRTGVSHKTAAKKNVKSNTKTNTDRIKLVSKRPVVLVKSGKSGSLTGIAGGKSKSENAVTGAKLRQSMNASSAADANKSNVAPRLMAPVEVFNSGDKIVFPRHGVGEIDNINKTVIGGEEHQIYSIKIIETGMKVMVPVSQASSVGLRRIADKRSVDKVYQILKDRNFKIDTQTWNRRFREYSQKINTGSVFEIAIVLRDLAVLGKDKDLSFGEKSMKNKAEHLLVSELAIAKSRPVDKIESELREIFN